MSYLEAVLIAEARQQGRAQRSATLRHRHLTTRPLGILLWQLGAEPFTAASVTWGFGPKDRTIVVPGEPRDRELSFRALTQVARSFNPWFEGGGTEPPQIVVPTRGSLALLGRLGRRLAYLPSDGDRPADPELVRFGRHLRFLAERTRYPGQQLVVVLTELLATHWVTGLSDLEGQSLPALDASIAPPGGNTGHAAAIEAERIEIGPMPAGEDDDLVDPLITRFNAARGRGADGRPNTTESVVARLRAPILAHYERLTDRGWPLLWRCLERERQVPEAPSAGRRWERDVAALDRHLEWVVVKSGYYRTRQTSSQAAFTLRSWEEAQRLVVADEAIDDPLRMIPYILSNQAIVGKVIDIDLENREKSKVRMVARPLVKLATSEPCTIQLGKALYWTQDPGGCEYVIEQIEPSPKGAGSIVVLKHGTSVRDRERPAKGTEAIFSVYNTKGGPPLQLPENAPWTHKPKIVVSASIEAPDDGAWE